MNNVPTLTKEDVSNGLRILVLSWIECTVGILVVGARIFVRAKLVHHIGKNDWTIIFVMASAY